MQRTRWGVPIFVVAISAMLLSACNAVGLSKPKNDDGADVNNPNGANPGTPTLQLSAANTDLAVGEFSGVTVTYGGAVLNGGGAQYTVTTSDSSELGCCATGISVGGGTLTYTYQGAQASIGFSVHQNENGAWAHFVATTNSITGASFWYPGSVHVPVGSIVEFEIYPHHTVTFDSIPGAPKDIPAPIGTAGQLVSREFQTAGTFTFRCATHGETGSIVVTP